MEQRKWTQEELLTLVKCEKISIEGVKEDNQDKLFMALQMLKSLQKKGDLFVVAYKIEEGKDNQNYSNWQKIGVMSILDYYNMLYAKSLDESGLLAFHPVNFDDLEEFDAIAH